MLQRIFQRIIRCLDVQQPDKGMRKTDELGFCVLSGRLWVSGNVVGQRNASRSNARP